MTTGEEVVGATPGGAQAPAGDTDVVMIGAGIMSATLAVLLKKLQPEWTIGIFERLDVAGGRKLLRRGTTPAQATPPSAS
jgi:glycine/D-amino acid oxidase-like deaminating enzyme